MGSLFVILLVTLTYWAPTILSAYRKLDNTLQLAVVNFFGFTFLAWVVAAAMAVRPKREEQEKAL